MEHRPMSAIPSGPAYQPVGSEPDPLIGRVINDRYKVTEQIGHGGMGKVYKALQSPLDRVVALKVLGAGHDRDPNFYKRFALEASVTAKLTHPNTITLYDYGRTPDGIFFIAMEYLNGRTLSAAMQQDGPLEQARVVHIAQQICRSLREAHALGIIHRDLKPANVILLRQHDDHDFVKVLDFGLVKFFSGDAADNEITNAGTFMGSPHYIAPEQARNQSPDQRCDIYSLGVLLYHMLTGRVPFTAQAPVDIILKHLHETPTPLRRLRPDLNIDPQLEDIVLKCMAKVREQRFQSMDELLAQLKIVRTQLTGISGPHSLPPFAHNTEDGLRPVSLADMQHVTPSAPQRTPSGPLPSLRLTPAGGMPSLAVPPPPPADDESGARSGLQRRVAAAPAFGGIVGEKRAGPRPILLVGAGIAIAAAAGLFFVLRSATPQFTPSVAVANPVAAPAVAVVPAPPSTPASYPTANAGTTLVSVTSQPSGAEVRDVDDRLLGMTPFDLRVPSSKPLHLTLKHDGFKALVLKKTVSGDRVALSGTLKRDPKADLPPGPQSNKRSVGYKDDPY
jgi:serine/threonine protein kinase